MDRYKLIDAQGRVLANSLTIEDESAFSSATEQVFFGKQKGVRYGRCNRDGCIVLLATEDHDLVASKRKFLSRITLLLDSFPSLMQIASATEERFQAGSKRLIHNLTSINAHMIQEVFAVVSQDRLAGNIRRSVPLIAEEMRGKRANEFARCFLSLAKHATAMKNEFAVFKKIERLDAAAELQPHYIHKVIMNVAYLFFSDFADNRSYVTVSHSSLRALMDYEFAFVALYHLFDNAAKYICPGTDVDVLISGTADFVAAEFSMMSLEIRDDEVDVIRDEGVSGAWPERLELSGDGIGLHLVDRVMALHGGNLAISRDVESKVEKESVRYHRNRFTLNFPSVASVGIR